MVNVTQILDALYKFNPNHKPSGTSEGGQFAEAATMDGDFGVRYDDRFSDAPRQAALENHISRMTGIKSVTIPKSGSAWSLSPDGDSVSAPTSGDMILARTARRVARELVLLRNQGYAMPDELDIQPAQDIVNGTISGQMTAHGYRGSMSVGLTVFVPTRLAYEHADLDDMTRAAFMMAEAPPTASRAFVVEDFRDVVTHEMGHVLNQRELENAGIGRAYDVFNEPVDINIAHKVSGYAARNAAEFIAETFVALRKGERFSSDVMELYRKYSGPEVKHAAVA